MPSILEALPGLTLPVSEVNPTLAGLWLADPGEERGPSEFRASQMNLILHFGLATGVAEAQAQFATAIRFAQRYPCRIMVLCPTEDSAASEDLLQAKLYTQCFIGDSHREMCCCEAILLGYRPSEARFLENQVSTWLENDLPTYHWFHRVPGSVIERQYLGFTRHCRRLLYDSAIDGYGLHHLPWPRPEGVRDLAWARLLPVRQALGHFLSGFLPADLADGLQEIRLTHPAGRAGEAENLACWFFGALQECRRQASDSSPSPLPWTLRESPDDALEVFLAYGSAHHFRARLEPSSGSAHLQAAFGGEPLSRTLPIRLLTPEETLAEALFF